MIVYNTTPGVITITTEWKEDISIGFTATTHYKIPPGHTIDLNKIGLKDIFNPGNIQKSIHNDDEEIDFIPR